MVHFTNYMKLNCLKVLAVLFVFVLLLCLLSLGVPPDGLIYFIVLFALAIAGLVTSAKAASRWKIIWAVALCISLLGGILEIVAGKRLAHQRSQAEQQQSFTNQPMNSK